MVPAKDQPNFPGFEKIGPSLGHGASSSVYLAIKDGKKYALKYFRSSSGEDPSKLGLLRAFKEAGFLARLNSECVPKILEVKSTEEGAYILMEFIEGKDLSDWVQSTQPKTHKKLELALSLIQVLQQVHESGFIHSDLKPKNILVNEKGHPRIIDFGFSIQAAHNLNPEDSAFTGTLAYASPEQLGVIHRAMDPRSDLYSLGVVLYELFSGQLPFASRQSKDLIYQQTYETPRALDEVVPDCPPGLSVIVQQLLAKDPDDRIASAELLGQCVSKLLNVENLKTAAPPPHFWGREEELAELGALWRTVLKGEKKAIQITGEPGSGKSKLLREFLRSLKSQDRQQPTSFSIFLGDSLAHQKAQFSAIRGAIDGAFRTLPNADLTQMIREAGKSSHAVLMQFSPFLKRIFVSETQNHQSFQDTAFSRTEMIEALTEFLINYSKSIPLLLIFDHFQWIDESSYQILSQVMSHQESSRVLIAAVTVAPSPLDTNDKPFPFTKKLTLQPLSEASTVQFISNSLSTHKLPAHLAEVIQRRSLGNPLLIEQILEMAMTVGALRPHWGEWLFEMEKFQSLQVPQNTLDFILTALNQFTGERRTILQLAAIVGSPFSMELIHALASSLTLQQIRRAIFDSFDARIIEREKEDRFIFVHQKIADLLLDEVPITQQRNSHQILFELLWRSYTGGETHIREVARHANLGVVEINPDLVCTVNYLAALKCVEQFDDTEAFEYREKALAILKRDLSARRDRSFHYFFGLLCDRIGHMTMALEHYKIAAEVSKPGEEKAQVLGRMASSFFFTGEQEKSFQSAEEALRELGFNRKVLSLFWLNVIAKLPTGLLKFALKMTSLKKFPQPKILLEVANEYRYIKFLVGGHVASTSLSLQLMAIEDQLENTRETALHHSVSALSFGHSYLPKLCFTAAQKARRVSEQLNQRVLSADLAFSEISALSLIGAVREADHLTEIAFQKFINWYTKPVTFICAVISQSLAEILRGRTKELMMNADRFEKQCRKVGTEMYQVQGTGAKISRMSAYTLMGRFKEASLEKAQIISFLKDFSDSDFQVYWYFYLALALSYLEQEGSDSEVDTLCDRFLAIRSWTLGDWDARAFFAVGVYLKFRQWKKATPNNKDRLKTKWELMKSKLYKCFPAPVASGHGVVTEAQYFLEIKNHRDFRRKLNKAESLGIEGSNSWVQFEVARLKARTEANSEKRSLHLDRALFLAQRHQWSHRLKNLIEEFSSDFTPFDLSAVDEHPSSLHSGYYSDSHSDHLSGRHSLPGHSHQSREIQLLQKNLETILKLNLDLAHVFEPEKQIYSALQEVVRLVGAERAALLLWDENQGALKLQYGLQANGVHLDPSTRLSRAVIDQVWKSEKPMVFTGSTDGEIQASESTLALDLRSIIAAPLLVQLKPVGMIYCDSRIAKGIFSESDVALLTAIGSQMMVSLEVARIAKLEFEKKLLQKDVEAKDAIQKAYQELEKTTQELRAIFTSINQGICLIDENFEIQGESSKQLGEILQVPPLGKNLMDLLFRKSNLTLDQLEILKTIVSGSVGEDLLFSFKVNQPNLPREISLNPAAGMPAVYLELDWTPITNSENIVLSILCTIRDVTQVRELKQQALRQSQELQILSEVFRLEPNQYSFFSESILTLNKITGSGHDWSLRQLHTMKGLARSYGLISIASQLHEIETELGAKPLKTQGPQQLVSKLEETLKSYLSVLSKLGHAPPRTADPFYETQWLPLQECIKEAQASATQLAQDLNKPKPKLTLSGAEILIPSQKRRSWLGAVTHLIRNSLDHGMTTNSREPEIHIRVEVKEGKCDLYYSDSGDGLNLAALLEKFPQPNQNRDWVALAQKIFEPGVSTQNVISEISGRGIGMDAFREEFIQNWGGGAEVLLKSSFPTLPRCAFEIHFWISAAYFSRDESIAVAHGHRRG